MVLNLGSPDVLGLQLPEILASTADDESFWDFLVQEHLGTQGWNHCSIA